MRLPPPTCSFCGGNVTPIAGSNATRRRGSTATRPAVPPTDPQPMDTAGMEAVQEQAATILSQIINPVLLEEAAHGAPRPTDKDVLESLPLVKIEPYVGLRVTATPPKDAASASADANPTPSRQLLAEAAERRAAAAAAAGTGAGAGTAAAETSSQAASSSSSPSDEEKDKPLLEFRGTGSAFGTPLADIGDAGVSGRLVLVEPADGSSELKPKSYDHPSGEAFGHRPEIKGSIAIMWRGGCSFVDKIRRAQQAGCVGAVVVQGRDQKWPFTMSDTAGKGNDLELPSLMLNYDDGEKLRAAISTKAMEQAMVDVSDHCGDAAVGEKDRNLYGHAISHDNHTTCTVCLQEMLADEMAVRLPCQHLFHEQCVRTWLGKQHTCPTCRKELPTPKREGEGPPLDLVEPPSWSRPAPWSRPPPASGMYS